MSASSRDILSRIPIHDISGQGVATRTLKCAAVPISFNPSQGFLPKTHNLRNSCAPLVIDRTRKCHSPSQITIPTGSTSEAPAQHPDMLAMLQELDCELANWNQGMTYHKRPLPELPKLDTLIVRRSPAPVSYPHAQAKSPQSIGSSNSSVIYTTEEYYSSPCESPISSLATGDPLVRPLHIRRVSFAPLPSPSPPSGMKAYLKRKRSATVPVPKTNSGYRSFRNTSPPSIDSPPSGVISLVAFFKRSHPNTVPVPQTTNDCIPKIWRNAF